MAFHIHVPKPLHGWKAFVNEIAVIVIGVLIALGLEAGLEWLHWQHKAEDGRERLQVELNGLFGASVEQVTVTPCILAQLDLLQKHLESDGANATPMPIDTFPDNLAVLRLPTRPWSNTTWESLQQDGTTAHFPILIQRYMGTVYGRVTVMKELIQQSGDVAGRMLATSRPGKLDAGVRTRLLLDVSEQYRRTQYMSRIAGQLMGSMRDLHLQPTDKEISAMMVNMTYASNTIGYCKDRGLPLANWKDVQAKVPDISKRPI